MLINNLVTKELIDPPTWLPSNTCYLTIMGSMAYGVSTDNSDMDIYGVCVPPKKYTVPSGIINGFDQLDTFNQWQKHHVSDQSAAGGKGINYDFSIYGIVNYFKLAMECNPNVIDSLFVRRECIKHITEMWEIVRSNRKLFLHKGVTQKCRGYAYSQLQKAKNCIRYTEKIRSFEEKFGIPITTTYNETTTPEFMEKYTWKIRSRYDELWSEGLSKTKRFESQKIYQCDPKFLYHVFRLVDQAKYILHNHDLDLQEESRKEKMKAIRRGDITHDEIVKYFSAEEKVLESLYETSTLRHRPPKEDIRNLLLTCLEHHYGSIDKVFKQDNRYENALKEIKQVYERFGI